MREINLLPPARRLVLYRKAVAATWVRLANHALLIVGTVSAVAVVAAIALRLATVSVNRTAQVELTRVMAEYTSLREQVAAQQQRLRYLADVGDQTYAWTPWLKEFLPAVPPDATVADLTASLQFEKGRITGRSFALSGATAARSTLVVFEERLRGLPSVTKVEAPSSNLIRQDNPRYLFQLTLKPDAATLAVNGQVHPEVDPDKAGAPTTAAAGGGGGIPWGSVLIGLGAVLAVGSGAAVLLRRLRGRKPAAA